VRTSSTKKFAFYAIFLIASLLFSVVVVEVLLKFVAFSSGTASGAVAKRWAAENWKPINSLGYRDVELDPAAGKPVIVCLGDSFTAGHGVRLEETFCARLRDSNKKTDVVINLGQPGTSTKNQIANFATLLEKTGLKPKAVVHQYFGNDIEDYMTMPTYERSWLRKKLIGLSEIANLIDTYFFSRSFGDQYVEAIYRAYDDGTALASHLSDLDRLHGAIRATGAKLTFVVFPFLNNDVLMESSRRYMDPVGKHFLSRCQKGDSLVDVRPLAGALVTAERVVNALDAHPSPRLHALVADQLDAIRSGRPVQAGVQAACAAL
jgi:hypothetical protein